jgi:hypothetical protein
VLNSFLEPNNMPNYVIVQIVWFAILGVVVFSIWKGGVAERLAGCLMAAGAMYGYAVKIVPQDFQTLALLTGDFLLALGFLGLAVRYTSLWIGGAMLFQAVQFTLHAWYMLGEKPRDIFHGVVNNLDTVGILVCLIVGTATAWRRRIAAEKAEALRAQPAPTA